MLKKKAETPSKTDATRSAWLMSLPAVLLILLFCVVPIFLALALGFTNARLVSPEAPRYVGLTNFKSVLGVGILTLKAEKNLDGTIKMDENNNIVYESLRKYTKISSDYPTFRSKSELFRFGENRKEGTIKLLLAGDPLFWKSLRNTFYFAVIVVPIQGGFGLLLALLVNQKLRGRNFFRTIYFIPALTSMVVVSMLWTFIYQKTGLLNTIIQQIIPGYQSFAWLENQKTAMPAIIILSIWQAVGFHMIIWLGGLQTIPTELYEAARVDGAGFSQQFRYVTVPGLRHTFVFVFVTITIAALGLFTQIAIITQGGPLDSTSTLVYQVVSRGYAKQEIGYASSFSFVFFAIVLLISLIQRSATKRLD
jgi:multiple sugar transport system permease protein